MGSIARPGELEKAASELLQRIVLMADGDAVRYRQISGQRTDDMRAFVKQHQLEPWASMPAKKFFLMMHDVRVLRSR